MKKNNKQNDIITQWILWQFYESPRFLIGVWKNYILFSLNYFSLPILLKTLFYPWRRYIWKYPKGFDIAGFFNTLLSNMFSRFLGFLVRAALIVIGVFFQIFVIFMGAILICLWLFLPFIIIFGLLFAIFY